MVFDESYMDVAIAVVRELRKYTGKEYDLPFARPADVSRLAIAIQRAVEHKQAGGCKHEESCKDEKL